MLIYCKQTTPRIEYIFRFLLTEMSGISLDFTSDFDYFNACDGAKINYSSQASKTAYSIHPVGLLFESTIEKQQIQVFEHNGVKAFFETDKSAEIPFDLFAASFYLISRYEEYLPFRADNHQRFPATESLAFKNNFLTQPVVNIWLENLKKVLLRHFPDLQIRTSAYQFISSIDVDNGYAYMGKSWWKTFGAFSKHFLKFDFKKIRERTLVLCGFKKDPFDEYNFQHALQLKYKFSSLYFLLCGKSSKNDHNILPQGKAFNKLVNKLAGFAEIGIHPSYTSNKYPERVKNEKQVLEKISNKKITRSRQHFLKLKLPNTYSVLINSGIQEDYTMGYASHPGFRAGICTAFNFYNLEREQRTELKVFPFAIMDVTFSDYMNLNASEAINLIIPIVEEIKKVNGLFISVWHDRNFENKNKIKGWNEVYEEMVTVARSNQCCHSE
ncbi:MAG TPA: polysaccharide deacetylase family protein [Bacteroidia bacterium]|nr:polysaccharide deacetylase family protein [Bacteroidia bacterium]